MPCAKVELDQGLLHTQRAIAENGYGNSNNAKREIKTAIDALMRAYTLLNGKDERYRGNDL